MVDTTLRRRCCKDGNDAAMVATALLGLHREDGDGAEFNEGLIQ